MVVKYDAVTFYIDGRKNLGEQTLMLGLDTCESTVNLTAYQNSTQLINDFQSEAQTLGLASTTYTASDVTSPTPESGVVRATTPARRLEYTQSDNENSRMLQSATGASIVVGSGGGSGQLLGLQLYKRELSLSEVQGYYYNGINAGFGLFQGKKETPPDTQTNVIKIYDKESVRQQPRHPQSRHTRPHANGNIFTSNMVTMRTM